jgi:hypothetical protein
VTNFVLEAKILKGKQGPPEGRIAKHHFRCDENLVPNHPSVEVLKQLAGFRPGSRRFPWSRLRRQDVLIRFGEAPEPGHHNPVIEITPSDRATKRLPAAHERRQDSYPQVKLHTFSITWKGRTADFSDCNEFKLLVMLIEAAGDWVTYEQIEESIIQDTEIVTNRCAPLKYRLVQKIQSQKMGTLAEAIESGKRRYRLSL